MRVGMLSSWDMEDPSSWSGVVLPACQSLAEKVELVPLQVPKMRDSMVDRLLTRLLGLLKITYLPGDSFATSFRKARAVRKLLNQHQVDVVVSFAAAKESLGVPAHIPLVQVTDSSFKAIVKAYFKHDRVSRLTLFQGVMLDRWVARRSDYFCVASEWSAQQLINDNGVNPAAIRVLPFGPGTSPVSGPLGSKSTDLGIAVLFIASNWARKGGERALKSFRKARLVRPELTLTVVGAPPPVTETDGVKFLPRQTREELSSLYRSHHLLLEPTEASAGGVVVTDALNHGLPVLSTLVGGIPTLVRQGETGWLVSQDNAVEEMAELLVTLTPAELTRVSAAAEQDASQRLTWENWSQGMLEVCEKLAA